MTVTLHAYLLCKLMVLNESVAKALMFSGDSNIEETARFIESMDKMFDCLDVHNFFPWFSCT